MLQKALKLLIILIISISCSPKIDSGDIRLGSCAISHKIDPFKSHIRWVSRKNESVPVIGTQLISGYSQGAKGIRIFFDDTLTYNALRDGRIKDILFQNFVTLELTSSAEVPQTGNTDLHIFDGNFFFGDRSAQLSVPGYITRYSDGFNVTNGDKRISLMISQLDLSDKLQDLASVAGITIDERIDLHYDIYFYEYDCQ